MYIIEISIQIKNKYGNRRKYYTTDKYSTRINWKVIDAGLSLAEQARILNNTLGFLIGAGSLLLSIRPNTVYHIDYIYTYVYDPMYWKANVNIYRYSNYTSLLDAYTKTWFINQYQFESTLLLGRIHNVFNRILPSDFYLVVIFLEEDVYEKE